jgi:outer membrane protein OmpA-like peptidoglycan-associated protein
MARLVAWLKDHPLTALSLRGYIEQREAERRETALREQRAAVVRDILIQAGIASERIQVLSPGESTALRRIALR